MKRYSKLRLLSKVGDSATYLVEDRLNRGRVFELKSFKLQEEDYKATFRVLNILTKLSRIKHPFIGYYHCIFIEDGCINILSEHLAPANFSAVADEVVSHGKFLSDVSILRCITGICLALVYLEKCQIFMKRLSRSCLSIVGSGLDVQAKLCNVELFADLKEKKLDVTTQSQIIKDLANIIIQMCTYKDDDKFISSRRVPEATLLSQFSPQTAAIIRTMLSSPQISYETLLSSLPLTCAVTHQLFSEFPTLSKYHSSIYQFMHSSVLPSRLSKEYRTKPILQTKEFAASKLGCWNLCQTSFTGKAPSINDWESPQDSESLKPPVATPLSSLNNNVNLISSRRHPVLALKEKRAEVLSDFNSTAPTAMPRQDEDRRRKSQSLETFSRVKAVDRHTVTSNSRLAALNRTDSGLQMKDSDSRRQTSGKSQLNKILPTPQALEDTASAHRPYKSQTAGVEDKLNKESHKAIYEILPPGRKPLAKHESCRYDDSPINPPGDATFSNHLSRKVYFIDDRNDPQNKENKEMNPVVSQRRPSRNLAVSNVTTAVYIKNSDTAAGRVLSLDLLGITA